MSYSCIYFGIVLGESAIAEIITHLFFNLLHSNKTFSATPRDHARLAFFGLFQQHIKSWIHFIEDRQCCST